MAERVLIYRLGSLGDTIIVLPAFHLVRRAFPEARITLLTNFPVSGKAAAIEEVLGGTGLFDDSMAYPAGLRNPGRLLRLVMELRRQRFTHLVYLAKPKGGWGNLRRDEWLFRTAGIRRLIGLPKSDEDLFGRGDRALKRREWDCTRTLRCLRELGEPDLDDDSWWDLCLTENEKADANAALAGVGDARFVAFSIGTKAPSKDWEDQNWVPLLRRFRDEYPHVQAVFLGSADEAERCGNLLRESGMAGMNLCGRTNPRVSAAVLARADLFVGHDSGPMHLAACVGTPAVAVFAARNLPEEWFPRGGAVRNRIIYHETECAGCGLVECVVERKRCILSITVDEVLQACRALMSK